MRAISLGSAATFEQKQPLAAEMPSKDGAIIEAHNQIRVNLRPSAVLVLRSLCSFAATFQFIL
jgi:hypothetical protein